MKGRGLVLAAPTSGSGKTTLTLGLLRALSRRTTVKPAKSGPDYIDPAFHEAACGRPSMNLDAWAMSPERLRQLAATKDLLIVEGAMGLFDGAPNGRGSTAQVAKTLGLPVVLVVDARAMSHSVAALVRGFRDHDPELTVAGVILNRVGSPRHEKMLRGALASLDMPVFGALPRTEDISLPSRHLGLVQALEHPDLDTLLDRLAALVETHVDLGAVEAIAGAFDASAGRKTHFNRRIAVARDAAFSFLYAKDLATWQQAGWTVLPFSPLANEAVPEADEVLLPGGYPELHGETLARAQTFKQSLKDASLNIDIKGECGGYMTLGEALIDADGTTHEMAGLLPLVTSFQTRKLHLGYRRIRARFGTRQRWMAHEFHYATTLRADGTPAYDTWDAEGTALGPTGLVEGRVSGSFAHIIDIGSDHDAEHLGGGAFSGW